MLSWSHSLPCTIRSEYDPIKTPDEESNRPAIIRASGPSRLRFRLLNRVLRLLSALLLFGVLLYRYLQPSANLTFSMPETPSLDSIEPSMDSVLSYSDSIAGAPDADWSRYAYVQYVTDSTYLCNSLMIFESLHRLGSRAQRLMMYPDEWCIMSESSDAALLRKARDEYSVKLQPVRVQRLEADITWGECFTKLLAFNQTQYNRVVVLDSDANVLQAMDELFFLPQATVAMPRAYWLDNTLSSQLVVIQPSEQEFERIEDAFNHRNTSDFDMEILNDLYGKECLILPHRYYDLITGEFRNNVHHRFLDSGTEHWNARRALSDAKYLHFSDWPYPKPWSEYSHYTHDKLQPPCQMTVLGEEDCSTRDVWNEIYFEFLERRQRVCGLKYMPE